MSKLEIDGVAYKVEPEVAALLQALSEKRDELKELVIWMTGCGYDFCQHDYFIKKRDDLLK